MPIFLLAESVPCGSAGSPCCEWAPRTGPDPSSVAGELADPMVGCISGSLAYVALPVPLTAPFHLGLSPELFFVPYGNCC